MGCHVDGYCRRFLRLFVRTFPSFVRGIVGTNTSVARESKTNESIVSRMTSDSYKIPNKTTKVSTMARKTGTVKALYYLLSCTIVAALQLQQSWQAAPGSVLATAQVSLSTGTFLATAGHDGGRVRLWKLRSKDGEDGESLLPTHQGSVFALESSTPSGGNLLVSGSFDRSAKVQRISFNSDGGLMSKTIASLPEHTGWVRGVRIVDSGDKTGSGAEKANKSDSDLFFLSIGCNLINVWTTSSEQETSEDAKMSRRLARLDGGPSPGDPLDEPFRRHDILAIDVAQYYKSDNDDSAFAPWIVAGLVDGTLRVFKTRWGVWKSRTQNLLYDSTGSCSKTVEGAENDDLPVCSVKAHDGRVTGVHAVPHTHFVVSVGYDGCWRQWKIDLDLSSVELVAVGDIVGSEKNNPTKTRISSSVIAPQSSDSDVDATAQSWSLVMGTAGGQIYRVLASELGLLEPSTSELIWSEEDASITALTCIDKCANDSQGSNGIFAIAAGTSKGIVRLFT
jgi:WD40 repeat protein